MNGENKGSNSSTPENFPVKRKRGRPRKDERQTPAGVKASDTPGTESVKRTRQRTSPVPNSDDIAVGQVVSGVLDGKFEAGYLLSVKVGDSNTVLRGVLFEPGKSTLVTGANDIAPHLNMLRRNDFASPEENFHVPMQVLTPEPEQKHTPKVSPENESFVTPKVSQPIFQVPKAEPLIPTDLQIKAVTPAETRNDTSCVQAAESGGSDELVESQDPEATQQAAESDTKKQSASTTQTSSKEHSETVEPTVLLVEKDASSESENPRDVQDAPKASVLEAGTEPSVEIVFPGGKTIDDQVVQAGNEAVGSVLKLDQIDDAAKNMGSGSNLSTVFDLSGPNLKPDMEIDNVGKSLEAEPNLSSVPDGSELKFTDVQLDDDAAMSLKPEPDLAVVCDDSELEPDMQADDARTGLEPEPSFIKVPDGSELDPLMQIDNERGSLETEWNLTIVPAESEMKLDDTAANILKPEINLAVVPDARKSLQSEPELTTVLDGSELKPDIQTPDAEKSLEPESNIDKAAKRPTSESYLTTGPDVSEPKLDQQTVDEPKDRESEINRTDVPGQQLTGLQKYSPLGNTKAEYSVEIERTEELEQRTKTEVEAIPRESILGEQNGSEQEDVTKSKELPKDEADIKASEVNVRGQEVVAPLVEARSSVSETNKDTDSLGGNEKDKVNQTQV